MSIPTYENKLFETEIQKKLKEAEIEALSDNTRLDYDDISKEMRGNLIEKLQNKNSAISKD